MPNSRSRHGIADERRPVDLRRERRPARGCRSTANQLPPMSTAVGRRARRCPAARPPSRRARLPGSSTSPRRGTRRRAACRRSVVEQLRVAARDRDAAGLATRSGRCAAPWRRRVPVAAACSTGRDAADHRRGVVGGSVGLSPKTAGRAARSAGWCRAGRARRADRPGSTSRCRRTETIAAMPMAMPERGEQRASPAGAQPDRADAERRRARAAGGCRDRSAHHGSATGRRYDAPVAQRDAAGERSPRCSGRG